MLKFLENFSLSKIVSENDKLIVKQEKYLKELEAKVELSWEDVYKAFKESQPVIHDHELTSNLLEFKRLLGFK